MRTCALLISAACLGLATVAAFTRPTPDEKTGAIDKLVRDLGSEDFDTREAASKALRGVGPKALPALIRARATTRDLEVRRRAADLILLLMPANYKSKALGLKMVRVYGDGFDMGSPPTEPGRLADEALHRVVLTTPLYLGAYEVTQQEYQKVMKANPSWFSPTGMGKEKARGLDTKHHPVEQVSWFDAVEFCNRLSKLDGFKPYYELSDVKREAGSITHAKVKFLGGSGYRLPTEAEWERACRAGTNTAFHYGPSTGRGMANMQATVRSGGYGGSYALWATLNRTDKVGSYPANAWGLYDMHGNVAEWCNDWYGAKYYASSPKEGPKGPATGTHRVLRGGHWLIKEAGCRSASRLSSVPGERKYYIGFRVARNP